MCAQETFKKSNCRLSFAVIIFYSTIKHLCGQHRENKGLSVSNWTALNSGSEPQKLRLLAGLCQGCASLACLVCSLAKLGEKALQQESSMCKHIFWILDACSLYQLLDISGPQLEKEYWGCDFVGLWCFNTGQYLPCLWTHWITDQICSENRKESCLAVSCSTDRPPDTANNRKLPDRNLQNWLPFYSGTLKYFRLQISELFLYMWK